MNLYSASLSSGHEAVLVDLDARRPVEGLYLLAVLLVDHLVQRAPRSTGRTSRARASGSTSSPSGRRPCTCRRTSPSSSPPRGRSPATSIRSPLGAFLVAVDPRDLAADDLLAGLLVELHEADGLEVAVGLRRPQVVLHRTEAKGGDVRGSGLRATKPSRPLPLSACFSTSEKMFFAMSRNQKL